MNDSATENEEMWISILKSYYKKIGIDFMPII